MKFAHLEASPRATNTILRPIGDIDATGLLKARTWLAYLHMQGRLSVKRFPTSDWVEYSELDNASPLIVETKENIVAVIPYNSFIPYHKQPGRALVRNDVEAQMLFTDVFLRASINYLNREPHILQQIKDSESNPT